MCKIVKFVVGQTVNSIMTSSDMNMITFKSKNIYGDYVQFVNFVNFHIKAI